MLAENLQQVNANIEKACAAVSRDPGEVTLVAVSKTKPVSMLQEAYDAGARVFGENKVQEIMDKYDQLPSDIQWHMIGHLQRNKVKYIIDKVAMIHSVDSLRLAQTIEQEAAKKDLVMPILLEVNVAEEESKFGLATNEVLPLLEKISIFSHIKVNINNVNMSVLSMGMTGDYQVAVQEGSTMVRVGTGIFGERNYATRQED